MYDVKVYNSVTEIDEKKWDSITGENQFLCWHSYLRAIEESGINDCVYHYPVIYDKNEIVAHACFYSMSFDLDIFNRGSSKKIIALIRKIIPDFLKVKVVECGTPVALGNTISFREGIDKKEAIKLISRKMTEVARKKRFGMLLIRDFEHHELETFDTLLKLGYKRLYNLPNVWLNVRWDSFEEYLNNLRSLYKKKYNKCIKNAQKNKLQIEITEKFAQYADELNVLWQNVYNNAKEYQREVLTPQYFDNMNKYLDGKAKMILARVDDKLAGFNLYIKDDTYLRGIYVGLDYEYNKLCDVYFNLFYEMIKLGIKEGCEKIEFGITTYVPKLEIGGEVEELYIYMKHLNPVLNPVMTKLFSLFTPQQKIKKRHVFKSSKTME